MSARIGAASALCLAVVGCGPRAPARPFVDRAAPTVIAGSLVDEPLVASLEQTLRSLGASAGARVVAQPMSAGERQGAFVELGDGECLALAARGAATVSDVDVALFDEAGAVLAVDEEPDARPAVVLCPPMPKRVFALAHVVAGEGLVVLVAHRVAPTRAGAVRQAIAAGSDAARSSWPELERTIHAHTTGADAVWEEQRRVVLAVDAVAPTHATVAIGAGECAKVVALPAPGSQLLDVELFSGEGAPLGRAREREGARSAVVCARSASSVHVAMRPPLGRGLAALLAFRAPLRRVKIASATEDVLWLGGSLPLVERLVALRQGPGMRVLKQLEVRTDRLATVVVPPPGPARCARITVLAGAPARGVDASLFDGSSRRVLRGEGLDEETLYWCGAAGASLEVIARDASGPLAVLASEVPARWMASGIGADVASRIATALHRAGDGERVAREVTAETQTPDRWPLRVERTIAARSCARSYWALARPGVSLEARAFDAGDGSIIDRQASRDVVALTACAGASARRVILEIDASTPPEPTTLLDVSSVELFSSPRAVQPVEPSARAPGRSAPARAPRHGSPARSGP